MKTTIKILGLFLFFTYGQNSFGQSNKEIALSKGMEAIKLMDNGNIDASIKLLEEAQKLDPENFDYSYELAYANFLKKDYKETIKILEKNINHKDASERLFQLLGNTYDIIGKSEKAFEVYDAGLKKYPNSGMIYLEKGNVHWGKKEYEKALSYYEKGIEVDPKFPSNYYRASRIYCSSTEEVWGLIYGEIFMNLERNSKRTAEISKLLFDTYKSGITFSSDSTMGCSFCKQMVINAEALANPKKMKLPFCMVYEPTLLISVAFEKNIDINSLHRIRKGFVENYYQMNHDKNYPNALFDYQNKVNKAGHLEAYNHWILMKGDEDGFDNWHKFNKNEWDAFVKWFTENPLQLDDKNKFYRAQY